MVVLDSKTSELPLVVRLRLLKLFLHSHVLNLYAYKLPTASMHEDCLHA